jgi:hypothetical protein
MTWSFLCYKLPRIARHPWCSGEDLPQDSGHLRSRHLASSPTPVSRSGWRHSSPTDGLGVLAVANAVGISTWRAGATALWITSIEDNAALTYDFHATHGKTSLCKNWFRMFTWLHIPNTFVYMSSRVAQDHNKGAGRNTTLSTPSSTWREDPVATTWHRSFSFAFTCRSFRFPFTCRELYCLELSNFSCHKLYILSCYCVWYILNSLPILEAPHPGRQPNQAVVKRK